MSTTEYVCALSGKVTFVEDTGEDNLPDGWVRVTFQTRKKNPKWLILQQMITGTIQTQLAAIPEGAREEAKPFVEMQVEASFFGYAESIPEYLDEEEELTILAQGAALEAYNEIRTTLGLEKVGDGLIE